ncbi:MAG: type I-E CRISPR-associated endonuclease Cas1e [Elusimicrobiales bacterium]
MQDFQETEKVDRLIIKITRENLPQIKDRYPFLYIERSRIEIDDSSVKLITSEGEVIRLPIATITTLILGPGTSITHEAVKVISSSNCTICWVGEDSFYFYAVGQTPTCDTRNLRAQVKLSSDSKKSLEVAKRMFEKRFSDIELKDKTLKELMGMEGIRIKSVYEKYALKYGVGWKGRSFVPGKFEMSDTTNKILTMANHFLYSLISSVVYSLGYSPHIGFIHSGSPLPFVYDLADLYKEYLSIDLAFYLTYEMAGEYNRAKLISEFKKRCIEYDFLTKIPSDIKYVLYGEK